MGYSKLWKKVTGQTFAQHCRELIKAECFALSNEMVNPNKKQRAIKITPEIREYLEIEGITEEQFISELQKHKITQERTLTPHRFKKIVKAKNPRHNGGTDYCVCDDHKPGSQERIEDLKKWYENNGENSPFVISPNEEVDGIMKNADLLLKLVTEADK